MNAKTIISIIITLVIGLNLSAQNTENVYNENLDIYRVIAVKNKNEQIVSVSNTIAVDKPLTLYAPNVFSPDGDGTNDFFAFKGQGVENYSLEIYNRWGQMVFQANDLSDEWNGEYRGNPAPLGTYVYQVKAVNFTGENIIVKKGSVVLIR
ncbi:MAG: gliding motility-associated C-terminal domain-containing protein [Flavobacteriales bacterium]|jgi:gliding motility-associated-like protein|nr:gliding motility-associated C-terminal domain-containing protein [Flavobacteriales bacterium]